MSELKDSLLIELASDDPATREGALKALANPLYKGQAEVQAALAAALRHNEATARAYRIRQLAAEALGVAGDAAAVPALIDALDDENSLVRSAVAHALGQIGDAAATNPLIKALKDREPDVREQAVVALAAIDAAQTDAFVPLLADPEDAVRQAARSAIQAQGSGALTALVDALHHTDSTIRGAAAELLGLLKDERARTALDYTAKNDRSDWVKGRAKWALEQFPPPVFVPPQVRRGVAPPPPSDTLQKMRQQAPQLPTLQRLRGQAPAAPTAAPSEDPKTPAEIEALIDQLDVRLAKGEISEATYQRLVARWEGRLKR